MVEKSRVLMELHRNFIISCSLASDSGLIKELGFGGFCVFLVHRS